MSTNNKTISEKKKKTCLQVSFQTQEQNNFHQVKQKTGGQRYIERQWIHSLWSQKRSVSTNQNLPAEEGLGNCFHFPRINTRDAVDVILCGWLGLKHQLTN